MAGLDTEWASEQLQRFIAMTVMRNAGSATYFTSRSVTAEPDSVVVTQAHVVEKILDRVIPDWQTTVPLRDTNRWTRHREAAQRALTELERDAELREHLGDDAPTLSASAFHPWAWEGARSMWGSRHYRQGVVDALKKVQAETQNKTGRHDLSETKLFQQLFSLDPPKPDAARLRLRDDEGSDTYKSVHRGAAALAEGLFAGVRNPASHTVAETEADEQVALEQLAVVSVLARWVDSATVVRG